MREEELRIKWKELLYSTKKVKRLFSKNKKRTNTAKYDHTKKVIDKNISHRRDIFEEVNFFNGTDDKYNEEDKYSYFDKGNYAERVHNKRIE